MFKVGDRVRSRFTPSSEGSVISVEYDTDGDEFYRVSWNCSFSSCCWPYELELAEVKKETTTMDNPFIETVTTKVIKEQTKLSYPQFGHADVYLKPLNFEVHGENFKVVDIVIGARWEDANCAGFTKKTLGNLLKMLQEVHGIMKD